ncbi:hypothetical protein AB0G55_06250, partial [Streptomyces toyocaensis]
MADNSSASAALRRPWTLTRTPRWSTVGIHLLSTVAVAVASIALKWLGMLAAHWAGLLKLAAPAENVRATGVLVIITPVAGAIVNSCGSPRAASSGLQPLIEDCEVFVGEAA